MLAKENLLRAVSFREPEHVPYPGEEAYRFLDHRGRRPPTAGIDEWGVEWAPLPADYIRAPDEPLASFPVGHPADAVAQLLDRPFPDPAEPGLFAFDNDDRAGEALRIGRHPCGPLERFTALLGSIAALEALAVAPEASQAVIARIVAYHVGIARGYVCAGAEAGWIADDYAGQSGPLLSPALWRRLVLPGLARIFDVYRTAGLPVFFHTCGRAEAFVPDLLAAGVTVFNLESAACDLAALRARFGPRIAFIGGVSPEVMLRGGPADVARAAQGAIATLGREGGLILAPDQALAYPAANQEALNRAAKLYGRYPLS